IIISIIIFLIIAVVLATVYKYVYLNEQQHAQQSINYLFNNTANLVAELEKEYNTQLEKSLVEFYEGYDNYQDQEYIDQQVEKIKNKIYRLNQSEEIKVGKVNYYFINSQGKIFDTDYKADQGLNLSQFEDLWWQIENLEKGEVLLLPFDDETLTSKMRLYAYTRLPDGNYFEVGISFENFDKILLNRIKKLNQDYNTDLKLFTYNFEPFFNQDLKISTREKELLKQAARENELISDKQSFFVDKYYDAWSSKYGDLYAVLKVEHNSLRIIFNIILPLFVFMILIVYFTRQKFRKKVEQVLSPIEAIAKDMNYFYKNQESNLDQDETGILEIDNIIDNYKGMASEISASYQQLEAYSEELENKNEELASNKKKLRKIIDLSPDHIFIKNRVGKYMLVNQTHAQFFAKEVEEMEGMTEQELLQLDEQEKNNFLADDREVIEQQQEKITEDYATDKEGNQVIFETVKIPFVDNNEVYVLAIGRNITEQRRAQNKIEAQNKELEASYQQLEQHTEKILDLNQDLKDAYQERDKLVQKLEQLISLTSDLTKGSLSSKEKFLSQLLHSAFTVIDEADYGSVYSYGEENIEFIDTIGHDLELLQELNIAKDVFIDNPKEPQIVDYIVDDTITSLTGETKDLYLKASKEIKKTLIFSLVIDGKREAGLALDIARDSNKEFSEQSLKIINAFNSLAISFYTMQNYNSMQKNFQREIVSSLINLLEVHDQYTKGHSESVSKLGTKVAFELGLSIDEINKTYWAGMLHDIGKIVVPEEILNKTGRLSYEEYEKIKQHPTWGYKALKDSEQLQEIAEYIYYHHERPDGKGYPRGVTGKKIPLISKILTVVDAWDAMRSTRSYRMPLSKEKALQELIDNKGAQFDTRVVDAFISIVEKNTK
ncbi:MAG: HD domain-containing phosphohydrolase, partial [Bacillota bacterium]